jgi:hypothetical protein
MMIVVIMADNDKKIMRSMISTLISWWRKIMDYVGCWWMIVDDDGDEWWWLQNVNDVEIMKWKLNVVKNITIYILHDLGMQKIWKPTLGNILKYLSKDFHQIISSKRVLLLLQAYSYHNLQESKLVCLQLNDLLGIILLCHSKHIYFQPWEVRYFWGIVWLSNKGQRILF